MTSEPSQSPVTGVPSESPVTGSPTVEVGWIPCAKDYS